MYIFTCSRSLLVALMLPSPTRGMSKQQRHNSRNHNCKRALLYHFFGPPPTLFLWPQAPLYCVQSHNVPCIHLSVIQHRHLHFLHHNSHNSFQLQVSSAMQGGASLCFSGWFPPSGPSDSDLAGHMLQGDPGPFRAAAPDPALHFRGGSHQGRGWGPCSMPICCFGPFRSRKDHLHGHPVWP